MSKKSMEDIKTDGKKISTDLLLKSKAFSGYQPDFAKVVLTEPAYTKTEALAILANFFQKEGR